MNGPRRQSAIARDAAGNAIGAAAALLMKPGRWIESCFHERHPSQKAKSVALTLSCLVASVIALPRSRGLRDHRMAQCLADHHGQRCDVFHRWLHDFGKLPV